MAFEPSDVVPIWGLARQESIPLWTTGTICIEINTGNQVSAVKKQPYYFNFNIGMGLEKILHCAPKS